MKKKYYYTTVISENAIRKIVNNNLMWKFFGSYAINKHSDTEFVLKFQLSNQDVAVVKRLLSEMKIKNKLLCKDPIIEQLHWVCKYGGKWAA